MSKYCIALVPALVSVCASAQQAPDAGGITRQNEQQQRPALPAPNAPKTAPLPPEQSISNTGPTLTVSSFSFEGNELFSEAALKALVTGYLDRPVTLADLEVAAARVVQHYRAAGRLARVFLPRQEVDKGAIRFRVVEAVYGQTRFSADTNRASLPIAESRIVGRVQSRQAPGAKLHVPSVERGLLLADDLPGLGVVGSQIGGEHEGHTDVMLKATVEASVHGEISADNGGSRNTGTMRVLARAGWNGPLRRGDEFGLQSQFTRHMQFLRLAGSVPLGVDGMRLGGNISALHYEVGTAEFSALQPRGSSRSAGFELTYPFVRANDRNLYGGLNLDHKRPYNTTLAGLVSNYSINSAVLRLDANLFDTFGGSGISTAGLSQVFGHVNLDGSPTQAADAATVRTQGSYQVLRYRVTRLQRLGTESSLSMEFSGQTASKNLDSAERFYLGGMNGVRAYPAYEGSGSNGQLLRLEWHHKIAAPEAAGALLFDFTAFYDWGRVKAYVDSDFAGAPALNRYALQGAGVGLAVKGPAATYLSVVVARRIGNNPNPTPQGKDQNGTLDKTRVWLEFGKSF